MKTPIPTTLVFLATVLLYPQAAHAHSISPWYFGLGVYSFFSVFSTAGLILVPLLLVHVLILRGLVSLHRSVWAIAWRAAIIFLLSKIVECCPGAMFEKRLGPLRLARPSCLL